LVYPLVALVRRLTLQDGYTLLLSALLAVGVAFGLWSAGRCWKAALIGLAWFGLTALPPALLLPVDYVRGSVHVMHLAGVGAALFWGIAVGSFTAERQRNREAEDVGAHSRAPAFMASARIQFPLCNSAALLLCSNFRLPSLRLILSLLLLIGGTVVSLTYLNARRGEALRQSDYLWRLMALVEADPSGTVVINAPAFLAANDRDRLLLTTSEATMFAEGGYTNHADQLRAIWGREVPGIAGLLHPPGILPPPSYTFAPYWTETPADIPARLRDFRQIIATYFEGDHFYPAYVGGAGVTGSDTPLASFPQAGLDITELRVRADGRTLTVDSRWRAERPVEAIPLFQVWCDAALIAESRHPVWAGAFPFTAWLPGEVQSDSRPIHSPADFTPACLRLSVSVLMNGEPVPALAADGSALPENRLWAILEGVNP
jgi:hypothetical protein